MSSRAACQLPFSGLTHFQHRFDMIGLAARIGSVVAVTPNSWTLQCGQRGSSLFVMR